MRRAALALFLLLGGLWLLETHAQSPGVRAVILNRLPNPAVAAAYQGALDIIPGAIAARSFQCSSAAYSGNVADITDSATGNTTGTRLQCAGGVMSAVVSSSACTFVTGNACSTLATTCSVACNVLTLYGQVGTEGDATQATNATRPTYTASAVGGNGCMTTNGSQFLVSPISWATAGASAPPYSASAVAVRTGNTGALGGAMGDSSSLGYIGFNNTANTAALFDGTNLVTGAATDSSPHAIQGLFNGTSSSIMVDGSTSTTGAAAGTATWTGNQAVGSAAGGTFNLTGIVCEAIFWNASKAASFTALTTNQRSAGRFNF